MLNNGKNIIEIPASGHLDFHIVSPLPECLKDFEPHMGIIGAAKGLLHTPVDGHPLIARLELSNRMRNLEKYEKDGDAGFSEKEKEQINRAVSNYKECGFCYCYDWQRSKWGN